MCTRCHRQAPLVGNTGMRRCEQHGNVVPPGDRDTIWHRQLQRAIFGGRPPELEAA